MFALLVGATIGVGMGGVLGLAAANSQPTNMPDALQAARPHVGDRGAYTLTVVEKTPSGVKALSPEHVLVTFEVLPDMDLLDAAGQPLRVNRLVVGQHRPFEDGEWRRWYDQTLFHDASSALLVAEGGDHSYSSDHPGLVSGYTFSAGSSRISYLEERDRVPFLLCGLRSPIQDRPASLDAPLHMFPRCSLEDYYAADLLKPLPALSPYVAAISYGSPETRFQPVGVDDAGGYASVVLSLVVTPSFPRSGEVGVWISPEVAYPLRFVVQRADDPRLYNVIRLAGLTTGSEPIAGPGLEAQIEPAPDPEWVRAPPWGPVEEGFAMPFPLSEALSWAHDQPGALPRFMDSHPGSYLAAARFDEARTNDAVQRRWDLGFTDGREHLYLGVVDETRPRHAPYHDPGPLPDAIPRHPLLFETVRSFDNRSDGPLDSAFPPPGDRKPTSFPTLGSLARILEAYGQVDGRSMEPNAWGFVVGCRGLVLDGACAGAGSLRVEIGNRSSVQVRSALGQDAHEETERMLSFDESGNVSALWFSEQAQSPAAPELPLSPGSSSQEAVHVLSKLDVPLWSLPAGAYVVATGVVAVLAGIAYWLWPYAKNAVILPLYSRLAGPQALDHPTRDELARLVAAEPGIHFQELLRRTGRGSGTVLHHLNQLVRVEIISEVAGRGYTCYFPKGKVDRRLMEAAPLLKAEGARRLLEAVAARTGSTASQVARAVGLTRQTASYHLDRLGRAGLVTIERQGRELRLTATELGRSALGLGLAS